MKLVVNRCRPVPFPPLTTSLLPHSPRSVAICVTSSVRADMIKKNDMMSVKDVQEMLGVPLLGAIPEDTNVIVSTNRGEPLVLKKKLTLV